MFELKNLKIQIKDPTSSKGFVGQDKIVIEDATFSLNTGEIILILGVNGSGKSSLLNGIFHHPDYKIISGNVFLDGKDITNDETYKLARAGLHLFMQHIPEIEGVTLVNFLHHARKNILGDEKQNILETKEQLNNFCEIYNIPSEFLMRDLNKGLSGGEKKQAELLHILLLNPKFIFLDEADSGADVDTIEKIIKVIKEKKESGFVVVSHLQNIEEKIKFDRIYNLQEGKLIKIKE